MIRRSDGPKGYWGYYQDYLEKISGKKIQKKNSIDFQQKSSGEMAKKTVQKFECTCRV